MSASRSALTFLFATLVVLALAVNVSADVTVTYYNDGTCSNQLQSVSFPTGQCVSLAQSSGGIYEIYRCNGTSIESQAFSDSACKTSFGPASTISVGQCQSFTSTGGSTSTKMTCTSAAWQVTVSVMFIAVLAAVMSVIPHKSF